MALNNSESTQTAAVPTYMSRGWFDRVYGSGAGSLRSDSAGRLSVTVPALSAVVYRAEDHVPRSKRAPDISLRLPSIRRRDRVEIGADVDGELVLRGHVPRARRHGAGSSIGTDDNAPYRVFHDVADEQPGTRIEYKAVVLDNAGHTRTSRDRSLTVAPPAIALEAPPDDGRVRGTVEVRAVATPEHAALRRDDSSARSTAGRSRTIGTDSSSPVYTVFDDTSSLPDQARVTLPRRAHLRARAGR